MMKGQSWLDAARFYDRRLDDPAERLLYSMAWSDDEIHTAESLAFADYREHPRWADLGAQEIYDAIDDLAEQGFHHCAGRPDPEYTAHELEQLVELGYVERVRWAGEPAYRIRSAFLRDPAFREREAYV